MIDSLIINTQKLTVFKSLFS